LAQSHEEIYATRFVETSRTLAVRRLESSHRPRSRQVHRMRIVRRRMRCSEYRSDRVRRTWRRENTRHGVRRPIGAVGMYQLRTVCPQMSRRCIDRETGLATRHERPERRRRWRIIIIINNNSTIESPECWRKHQRRINISNNNETTTSTNDSSTNGTGNSSRTGGRIRIRSRNGHDGTVRVNLAPRVVYTPFYALCLSLTPTLSLSFSLVVLILRMVNALRAVGFDYVMDTNFGADLTIMEEANELLARLRGERPHTKLPLLTSCCKC